MPALIVYTLMCEKMYFKALFGFGFLFSNLIFVISLLFFLREKINKNVDGNLSNNNAII